MVYIFNRIAIIYIGYLFIFQRGIQLLLNVIKTFCIVEDKGEAGLFEILQMVEENYEARLVDFLSLVEGRNEARLVDSLSLVEGKHDAMLLTFYPWLRKNVQHD